MKIHFHIDRIVVDASLASDPRLLESGLAEELSRLLGQDRLPGVLDRDGAIGRVIPEDSIPGGAPRSLGLQAGRAIFEGLSKHCNPER